MSDWDDLDVRTFNAHADFAIGDVHVTPVPVPHDAREPTQFVFDGGGACVGVLTDLAHVTAHVHDVYRRCNALLIEANHDRDMLWGGNYPAQLKRRIASDLGHFPTSRRWRCSRHIGSERVAGSGGRTHQRAEQLRATPRNTRSRR